MTLLLLLPTVLAYSGSITPFAGYDLNFTTDATHLRVTITAATTGWVGFGIAEAGGMIGADIMMAHVADDTGVGEIGDYWSEQNAAPTLDASQDWSLLSASQVGGVTTVRAERLLVTGDIQDRPIVDLANLAPTQYIAAMGALDAHVYHGSSGRTLFRENVFHQTPSNAELLASIVSMPGVINHTFAANGQHVPAACAAESRGPTVHDSFRIQSFCAPGEQTGFTTYTEFCLDMSSWNAAHIVAVEPFIDPNNIDIVHHFTVVGFENSASCSGGFGQGFGAGWAPGAQARLYPAHAGVRVGAGGFQSIRLQVHYDNKRGVAVYDHSGIRIYRTEALRMVDVASYTMGDSALAWAQMTTIPEGLSRYDWYCPPAASQVLSSPIGVVGETLHMHITGVKMERRHYNASGGLKARLATEYYDFNYQGQKVETGGFDSSNQPRQTIEPGDSFYTSCWFDNRLPPYGRKVGNPATHRWGLGSDDEMCTVFGAYVPRQARAFSCAYGRRGATFLGGAVAAPGQSKHAFTHREFGELVAPSTCVDTAGWAHPTVGTCARFDREACEVHGWHDVAGSGTAREHCCVCQAALPPTCGDAFYHMIRGAQDAPSDCATLVANMAAFGLGCDTRWDAFPWRKWAMLPDEAVSVAAVCPSACGLCAGAAYGAHLGASSPPSSASSSPGPDGAMLAVVCAVVAAATFAASAATYMKLRPRGKLTAKTSVIEASSTTM